MAVKITPEYLCRNGTEDGEQAALFCFAQSVVRAWEIDEPTPGLAAATAPLWGLLYAIPNGGERPGRAAARMVSTGTKKGFPDVGLPVSRKGFHGMFVELKRRGLENRKDGGCQPEQVKWHVNLVEMGFCVCIAYGWEDARDVIDWYLNGAE